MYVYCLEGHVEAPRQRQGHVVLRLIFAPPETVLCCGRMGSTLMGPLRR